MSKKLIGKIAAVTGAASGIGLACVEAMIEEGAKVVLIDRNVQALDEVCKKLGSNAIPLQVDLLSSEDCKHFLEKILSVVDHIDIFYANAGAYIGGDLVDAEYDQIDRMLNLNINAVIKNVRAVAPHMIERKTGDIVVTSSIAGQFPVPWEPVYSPSKWAMHCFVQTMRRQLKAHGIRVCSVSPGPVNSALLADWPEENLRKAIESGSLIEPQDIAEGLIFTLTRSRNITIRDMVILPSNFDM